MVRPTNTFAEEEALIIDFSKLWLTIRQKWKLILGVTLSCSLAAAAISFLCHQEKYQSSGTLLFNTTDPAHVVTDIDSEGPFLKHGGGAETSPYKNQETLLKSRLMAQRILNRLKEKHIRISARPEEFQRSVISANQVKGTDFIEISAKASSPKQAYQIAQAYMDSYLSLMADIVDTPLQQKTEFFKAQVTEAELALKAINDQVEHYQEQYGIVDIGLESQNKVKELLTLGSTAKEVEANLAQKVAESARIRQQLKIKKRDLPSAIASVAAGQDDLLQKMEQTLHESQKDYQSMSLIYAVTNPEMQQLQQKIDTLKHQIADQQIINVGQAFTSKSISIKDTVRTTLVSRLAESESDISALQNKLATLRGQHHQMQQTMQGLPKQQFEYARLVLDQKNRENVLIRLKEKLSEVQIQKAAIGQKLQVIDTPNFPGKPLFPSRLDIILIAGAAGALFCILAISTHTVVTQQTVRPDWLEKAYGLPILAMIPWLPEAQWQNFRRRGTLEMTASSLNPELVKAYQDLALNLKVQRNLRGQNTVVVSSLMKNAGKSFVLANLAFCLAQSGERVILVDANLREPRLNDTFNHTLDYERGLPEVINTISEALYRSEQLEVQELLPVIQRAAIPSEVHPQLSYLNAGVSLDNTFEFLNSKGFGALIHVLKESYDWVLIDTPPFLQSPDAAILLGYAESLLLLAEAGCDESQILAVQHKVARLNSAIMGIVLRKEQATHT